MTRILLVEDDEEVGRRLEPVLISAGYEIDRSYTVAAACSHLDQRSYELVLADVRLPDGTGMDVADRAIEKGAKALIIAGCALLYPSLRRYEYLLSPVRPDKILIEMTRLLGSTPGCWAQP
jgi:two-component system, NtrC family, response regulator HydG